MHSREGFAGRATLSGAAIKTVPFDFARIVPCKRDARDDAYLPGSARTSRADFGASPK
jgi:hypothetical protein